MHYKPVRTRYVADLLSVAKPFRQRAFTLVELVTIIVILGIMALVAGPRFVGTDAFEANGSHGTLLSALRYAQKTAVAQRRLVYTSINTATKQVCLGFTADCSVAVIDPATQAAYSKTLSGKITLTASANPIAFDGLGRPVPNTTATITVQNAVVVSEPARTISVEAETGYVH